MGETKPVEPEKPVPVDGFPTAAGTSLAAWRAFFSKDKPKAEDVRKHVRYLHGGRQHPQVIRLLNAAIIEGQAQPWMYEILAASMEIEKHPKEDIERVVLSMADFGNANYESMMYSGAYLSSYGRDAAALKMYQQAARIAPDRPEAYAMGLKVAARTRDVDDMTWAACGALQRVWGEGHVALHQEANDLLTEAQAQLVKAKQPEKLAQFQTAATQARQRDLKVRLEWSGEGDLDLAVEDPAGGICLIDARESAGGGLHMGDGYGPEPTNCHEDYVCPEGFSGDYKITVKRDSGKIVGQRAVLTVTTHVGTPEEKKITRSVSLAQEASVSITITLNDGRRQERRTVSQLIPPPTREELERTLRLANRPLRRALAPEDRKVITALRVSQQAGAGGNIQQVGGGAIGFAPTVTTIREGASLAAQAIVSPDRRYVRMAISPTFNQIIDVVTFSFPASP